MLIVVQFILLALLMIVSYQDYKFRAVSWIIFPTLLIVFFIFNFLSMPLMEILNNSLINLCFIIFLFGMITLYFSVKHKRLVNLTNGFIGWGDVLFIVTLVVLFSPLNFILFYSISLLFIVAGVLISTMLMKIDTNKIPLAGLQALMLTILFLINLIFPFCKFSTDEWIVNTLVS